MYQLLLSFTEPPILVYPDYDLQFILHIDASSKGLCAVLLQFQENQLRVIGYGSRTLTQAEKKYHNLKHEFLAVKWAVYNHYITVTYINNTGKLSATGQRWVNELAEFNFSIHYRPGK